MQKVLSLNHCRKFYLLILIILVFFTASCKKNNSGSSDNSSNGNLSAFVTKNNLIHIASGVFNMGFEYIAEPVHIVYLSDFYINKHEVTYDLWLEVKNWGTVNGYIFGNDGVCGKDGSSNTTSKHPVTSINWYDAIVWCNAFSEKESLTPAYYTDANFENIYKDSSKHINIKNNWVRWKASGYRLPTEAEWEYVHRNRGARKGNEYSGSTSVWEVAWFNKNSKKNTHPVAQKEPNELGIYDMSGNVWEWCWDWQGNYEKDVQSDPYGPKYGSHKILRGGSWCNDDFWCDGSDRGDYSPRGKHYAIGFRVIRSSK